MRILHAPSNVCNISWAMAEGLRARGHHVEVWNHGKSPNDFPVDRVFELSKPAEYAKCLLEALDADFDVYHFHTTRSLIPQRGPLPELWDLPLLRSLGKRIVFTFHGSDIRLRSKDMADPWSFHNFADIPCDEARIKERLSIITTYADHLTVGNVLNRAYAPGATYIPKPINIAAYAHLGLKRKHRPVVLHATRKRETKGTDMIIAAVEALRAGGLDFEFRLLEGVSYAELMRGVADADIVVEKLLSGDFGVLAIEAMAMGKVVISRVRPEVYAEHPGLPVVDANPETFRDVLAPLIESCGAREEIAARGRRYVEVTHSPDIIAEKLEALYETPGRYSADRKLLWPTHLRSETPKPPEPIIGAIWSRARQRASTLFRYAVARAR